MAGVFQLFLIAGSSAAVGAGSSLHSWRCTRRDLGQRNYRGRNLGYSLEG